MVISKYKSIVILLLVIISLGILSLYVFWNPTETALFPKCPFHSLTGFYCPGCGSQRAIHDIIHGDIIKGIRHNYLFVLLVSVLLYEAVIYVKFKAFNQPTYNNLLQKPKVTNTILIVVILFWLLRNVSLFPFTELAP